MEIFAISLLRWPFIVSWRRRSHRDTNSRSWLFTLSGGRARPQREGGGGHKRKRREWKQALSLVLFPSVPLPLAKLLIGRQWCKHGEMSLSCPLNVLLMALSDAFGGNRYPEYSHQIFFSKKDSQTHSVSRCGPPQVQSKKAKHALIDLSWRLTVTVDKASEMWEKLKICFWVDRMSVLTCSYRRNTVHLIWTRKKGVILAPNHDQHWEAMTKKLSLIRLNWLYLK